MSVHSHTHHSFGFPGALFHGEHSELFHRILRTVLFVLVLVAMFLIL